MIFLTVGTQFPFDRLVKAVDDAIVRGICTDEVYGQIGETTYQPKGFRAVASLDKRQFDKCFREAWGVIGHAGMGTIAMALEMNKPLLVLPRCKRFGEVVNDHQVAIACKFEQLGHLLVAHGPDEVAGKMGLLRGFQPTPRPIQPEAVAGRIAEFLNRLSGKGLG